AVCTVAGFQITLLTAGNCAITASQAGNESYRPATPVVRTFAVTQATQTITFAKPANQVLTASPLTLTATSTSGLSVTLTSSTTAVCTVSGFQITLLTAGNCTVTASQAGNESYRPATPVVRTFAVTQ